MHFSDSSNVLLLQVSALLYSLMHSYYMDAINLEGCFVDIWYDANGLH